MSLESHRQYFVRLHDRLLGHITQWNDAIATCERGLGSLCGISERVVVLKPPHADEHYDVFNDARNPHLAPLGHFKSLSPMLLQSHLKAFDKTLRKLRQQLLALEAIRDNFENVLHQGTQHYDKQQATLTLEVASIKAYGEPSIAEYLEWFDNFSTLSKAHCQILHDIINHVDAFKESELRVLHERAANLHGVFGEQVAKLQEHSLPTSS